MWWYVRGRFGSEGKFEPYINEARDGYDAIEWIADQTWCDGNVGMIGASYNGSVQYCAAVEQPPHLKTIIPSVGSADLFYDGEYIMSDELFDQYLDRKFKRKSKAKKK